MNLTTTNGTTTVETVEDAFHRLDGDFLRLSEDGLDNARVRLMRALGTRLFGLALDPQKELDAIPSSAQIDRSLRAAVEAFVFRGPAAARPLIREHVESFPTDTLAVPLFVMSHVMSAVPGARDEALAYVRAHVDPDDWRTGPHLAMGLQEAREYDRARAIAERALAAEPAAAHAAHVLAHVHYETGEHAAGAAWLDAWMATHRIVMYDSHFPWHGALHALAEGDVEGALARYRTGIKTTSIVDAGSMLWRCAFHASGTRHLADAARESALAVLPAVPFAFPAFFGTFALAAAGDRDGLTDLARRCAADTRPGFADLVAPMATALAAFVGADYPGAITVLDELCAEAARVGGSNAQREIVEDTLIEALLRAGDAARAGSLLRRRLDRRPHRLDLQQLQRSAG